LQPRNLIRLALERIKRGAVEDPARAEPVYLYPKECQVRNLRKTRDEGRRTRGENNVKLKTQKSKLKLKT